jgi:chemotaxis signal transduction protein
MQAALPYTEQLAAPSAAGRPWQVFVRNQVHYAVTLEAGSELIEHRGAAAIPFAPRAVAGLVNWHGNAIPLVDLAALNHASPNTAAGRALVLGSGEDAVAVVVDGLPNVVRLEDHDTAGPEAAPPHLAEITLGLLTLPGQTTAYWLDARRTVDLLLSAHEH